MQVDTGAVARGVRAGVRARMEEGAGQVAEAGGTGVAAVAASGETGKI
jgi:hypothetical protein